MVQTRRLGRHPTPSNETFAMRCLLGFLVILLPQTLVAQERVPDGVDGAAAIRAAQRLLTAISTRDTTLARRVLLPGAQLVSIADPAGPETPARLQTDSQFLMTLAAPGQTFLERMWQPTVTIHGSVATVSAPYDFYQDREFSHCGTDVFTMVRSRGEWRVTHLVYTTQRQGCAPSPLGSPGA